MNYAQNLWACMCSPYVSALAEIVRLVDGSRLLWGSDYGIRRTDLYGYRLGLMDHIPFSDDLRRLVMERNPCRLLQLDP